MRLVLVILCCFSSLTAFPQKCELQKWTYKPVDFSNMVFVDSLYNKIRSDSSDSYHILLFTRYGEVNMLEGVYISFDSMRILKHIIKGSTNNHSVIKKGSFKLTGKEIDYNIVNKLNDYCGYYLGECFSSTETTHQNSTMVLANGKLKLWVEIDTMEGEISNVMDSDPRFKELNKLIKDLSKF